MRFQGDTAASRLFALAIILVAGGCMQEIVNVPLAEKTDQLSSRTAIDPKRQERLPGHDPRTSLTQTRIVIPTAVGTGPVMHGTKPQNLVTTVKASSGARDLPKVQEVASRQIGAAAFLQGPTVTQPITASSERSPAFWPTVLVLAVVVALLLVNHVTRRNPVPVSPDKPLAKLLHTRPWR